MKYTESNEMYLKKIYILSRKSSRIRATDLAKALKVSKSSVSRAVNMLCKESLVNHVAYGLIELTEAGVQKAREVCRKQDIVAAYLIKVLDIEPQMAMEEACKLEHVLGGAVILRMKQNLISRKRSTDGGGRISIFYT